MGKTAKELIRGAKLPERTVSVCLAADLAARMQQLEQQLDEARRQPTTDSLAGDGGAVRRIAEQIEALRVDMVDHTLTLTLRAVPRTRWTQLLADHKPREGNDADAALGLNADTFFDVLLRECTVDPALDDDDWSILLDRLSSAQYDTLTNAAWAVNRRDVDVPFSPAASRILSTSAPE